MTPGPIRVLCISQGHEQPSHDLAQKWNLTLGDGRCVPVSKDGGNVSGCWGCAHNNRVLAPKPLYQLLILSSNVQGEVIGIFKDEEVKFRELSYLWVVHLVRAGPRT